MKDIFIIGSKGIPANYGGFETFVDKLTAGKNNSNIQYHVSCLSDNNKEFIYNNARCFNIRVPNIGSGKAIYYDVLALKKSIDYIKRHNINNAIIYILACRIGPFLKWYKRKASKLNVPILVNPDGHEWKRSKWNKIVRNYWKYSEKLMVKNSDLLICDSKNIEKYIKNEYKKYNPYTRYIAYGADLEKSNLRDNDPVLINWYKKWGIDINEYYLIVGRFVPENNYETMIKEFMISKTEKKLVIITNFQDNRYYEILKEKTKFTNDNRIKFVGTVYNQELLKKIRENAFAYLHGHEVGGTNPSLLEALATTNLNILYDVGFNKEVGEDGAIYFNKEEGNLASIINKVDNYDNKKRLSYGEKSKAIIKEKFTWSSIIEQYENIFISCEINIKEGIEEGIQV